MEPNGELGGFDPAGQRADVLELGGDAFSWLGWLGTSVGWVVDQRHGHGEGKVTVLKACPNRIQLLPSPYGQ